MHLMLQIVDRLMWLGFEREINLFRKNVLGLEPLRIGQSGHDMLNLLKVSCDGWPCPACVCCQVTASSGHSILTTLFLAAGPLREDVVAAAGTEGKATHVTAFHAATAAVR